MSFLANATTFSSPIFKKYESIASDTDLIEDRPGWSVDHVNMPARAFLVEGAGNLVLKNNVGDDVTIVATAGQYITCQSATIDSTTSATNIVVFW